MKLQIIFREYCNGQSGGVLLQSIQLLEGTQEEMTKALETMKKAGFDLGPYYPDIPCPERRVPFWACDLAQFNFEGKISGTYEEGLIGRDSKQTITLEF